MKKVLLLLVVLLIGFSNVFAANTGYYISSAEAAKIQKEVSKVGIRLLNSNGLKNRTVSLMQIVQEKLILPTGTDRL